MCAESAEGDGCWRVVGVGVGGLWEIKNRGFDFGLLGSWQLPPLSLLSSTCVRNRVTDGDQTDSAVSTELVL